MKSALLCGSRAWKDKEPIIAWLVKLQDWGYTTIISGGASGADTIAANEARRMGFSIRIFYADWETLGRKAGFVRNRQMLTEGKPDIVVAFLKDRSTGTLHMVNLAKKNGVDTIIVEK